MATSSSVNASSDNYIVGNGPPPPVKCGTLSSQQPAASKSPVRYLDGFVLLSEDDLAVPAGGLFGQMRTYGNLLSVGSYAGETGYNWWVEALPWVAQVDANIRQVSFSSNNTYWFETYDGTDYFPAYFFLQVALVEDDTAGTLTFTNAKSGRLETTVFNSLSAATNPGAFISYTDGRGVTTTVTSRTGAQVNEVQRSYTVSGVTTVESLVYTYVSSGSASGLLASVEYRVQVGSGGWTPVKQVTYDYYSSGDSNGSTNDLRTVTKQLPDGSGGWNTVGVSYYRYWLSGSSTGFVHGLKMRFGPEAYRLMFNDGIDPLTASDADILPYADNYFEYDPGTYAVTKEIAAVCASCSGGGTTTDLFSYTFNPRTPSAGYNTWKVKTTQTLPDSSSIVVYTNFAGLPMLTVNVDADGNFCQSTFNYYYPSFGTLSLQATSSAIAMPPSLSTLEAYDDLLNRNATTGAFEYLNDSSGLVRTFGYSNGGSITESAVQEGQSGTEVAVMEATYSTRSDSAGNEIEVLESTSEFPAGSAVTTSYSYTWTTGTTQMASRTTTFPAVTTGQNGSGSSDTLVEDFDQAGNVTQRTDERGFVNTYTYDPVTSMLTQQVLNYQSGVTGVGINVTTSYSYDSQGRLTQTIGQSHDVVISGSSTTVQGITWMVYVESVQPGSGTWGPDQVWTGTGYSSGSGPTYTLVDPVQIMNLDKDGRSTDSITSARSSGSGALSPTDTFNQSDWKSWSSTQYDDQHQMISSRTYFLIPSSGTGTAGTNYAETDYGYDALERKNRLVSPVGTITRTVWTCPQRMASVWVGTDDTGATDSNPAGSGSPNNMVIVTSNTYDGGVLGGDGTLTQVTQYVSATSGDTRVTSYGYDFRDRRINMTGEVDVYEAYTLVNLDRATQTDRHDTSASGNLIGRTQTAFDNRNRVYQQLTYAVDPGSGTVGNALTSNAWYDPSGNLLQKIEQGDGQAFNKFEYNGVGWVTVTYRGYCEDGADYAQAQTVSDDTIVTQTIPTYDAAGNTVSSAFYDRLNDAAGTGALSGSTGPLARISYSASWTDGIDRVIAAANYGAIGSFTRPSTPPSASDTILVSLTAYDDAGRPYQMTDPKGIVTQTTFDAAGRVTSVVEDYGTGLLNRTTNTTYALDGQVATLTAVNSATGDQVTTYTYGTNLTSSSVARNDLLSSVTYPDSVSGSDVVSYAYNRLGQQRTITDQRGTVRTLYYDPLGRVTNDCVTTVGTNTDSGVLQIATAYEVRGMVASLTSYDSATQGSGTVLNQVALTYNDFGQVVSDEQAHSGATTGSDPTVEYDYDDGSNNQIRPDDIYYPTSISVGIGYEDVNDWLNRPSSVHWSSFILLSGTTTYTYLGSGLCVRRDTPVELTLPPFPTFAHITLDLWGGTTGVFTGLDLFNRVIDQHWLTTSTTTDRFQYGYDRNSNRTWKANVVAEAASQALDELYSYDNLNRLVDVQRGTLNSTQTAITSGTGTFEQVWGLDATGNWGSFEEDSTGIGTFNLVQARTANKVNEITNITNTTGGSWASVAYDQAGNMTTFPQPATPGSSYTAVYDAWNRLVSASASGSTVATYAYDGRNYRIVKTESGTTTHAYYNTKWQLLEEQDASGNVVNTYEWGLSYTDELVLREDGTGTKMFALQDANYNVTAITNVTGAVEERYTFAPYGTRTILTPTWGSRSTSSYAWIVGHQGLFLDGTGLIYNRRRNLHPLLGLLIQRDPLDYIDGSSLYEYVASNPATFLDSTGLACEAAPVDGLFPPQMGPTKDCREACARNQNLIPPDAIGTVLCLPDGRKCICTKEGDRNTTSSTTINDCAELHEFTHILRDREFCPCRGKVCAALYFPVSLRNSEECAAYTAEYKCVLQVFITTECSEDPICSKELGRRLTTIRKAMNEYCPKK